MTEANEKPRTMYMRNPCVHWTSYYHPASVIAESTALKGIHLEAASVDYIVTVEDRMCSEVLFLCAAKVVQRQTPHVFAVCHLVCNGAL